MTAICYSASIKVIPTNKQLLGQKTSIKFQINISSTDGLVRVHISRPTEMAKSSQLGPLIIYIYTLLDPIKYIYLYNINDQRDVSF